MQIEFLMFKNRFRLLVLVPEQHMSTSLSASLDISEFMMKSSDFKGNTMLTLTPIRMRILMLQPQILVG
jgi:hypothetical protein